MPIVQVTALRQRVGVDLDVVSRAIADAVSRELGEKSSGTWAIRQTLAPGAYPEGVDDAPSTRPMRPIRRSSGSAPSRDGRRARGAGALAVAGIVVRELGLQPGNAFVAWDELHAGRVHTGGGMPGP